MLVSANGTYLEFALIQFHGDGLGKVGLVARANHSAEERPCEVGGSRPFFDFSKLKTCSQFSA
jgi:hypothetical protein